MTVLGTINVRVVKDLEDLNTPREWKRCRVHPMGTGYTVSMRRERKVTVSAVASIETKKEVLG
jgi:hypothetical protein